MKPSEMGLNEKLFGSEFKNVTLPNDTSYNFLYERNKNYMENVAIRFENQEITYADFHTIVDEYARSFYKRGVRENDVIVTSTLNTPEAIYISYALNKLGAINCPINPFSNEYMMIKDLEMVRPKMFIGINDAYGKLKKAKALDGIDVITFPLTMSINDKKMKVLYNLKSFIDGNNVFKVDRKLKYVLKDGKDFKDVIYPPYKSGQISDIMFTGGSSGIHKGVELDSNGINCVARSLDFVTELKPGDVFMGNLPQFIAFGKLSLHYALCKNLEVGLTLKGLPEFFKDELYKIKPAGAFAGPIQWEHFINGVFKDIEPNFKKIDFTLSQNESYIEYLNQLKKLLENCNKEKLSLDFLKMAVSGGEQLKMFTELVMNMLLEELGAPDNLWNGLGMTEMWAPVAVKKGKKSSDHVVGTVIPFNNQMVIDPNTREELGVGETGLLCVTGPGMMIGYHNNEEENAKAFIVKNNQKWLVTGDIVKLNEKGEIEYIDRLKRCFVCGIENIYPQQIEDKLSEIPEIEEAIVTKVEDNELQYVPKYHIVLRDKNCNVKSLEKKIDNLIKSTLGESSMARYYEFYDEPLPRTASGKLDPKPLQEKDIKIKKLVNSIGGKLA